MDQTGSPAIVLRFKQPGLADTDRPSILFALKSMIDALRHVLLSIKT